MELLGSDFGMIVSDKTGAFPGDPGLGERLAFVYNRRVVRRTEVATDITYDRSRILATIVANNDAIHDALEPLASYEAELARISHQVACAMTQLIGSTCVFVHPRRSGIDRVRWPRPRRSFGPVRAHAT